MTSRFSVEAPSGVPEVRAGDDLAALVVAACAAEGVALGPGDVVCVSSKVVSKSLGLTAADRDAAVAADSRGVVAARMTPRGVTRVVRSAAGPVMAAAGVDESNTGPGGAVLRLPADPDAEARRLRRDLAALLALPDGAVPPAVVVTDTAGRPWRDGQVDFALGIAGLVPVEDARGTRDADGRPLEVTVRAVADEVAAAAELVKGKAGGRPVAVVHGLAHLVTAEDGPGAARLVRDPAGDWFGLGDVEAVHRALGVDEAAAARIEAEAGLPPAVLPGDPYDTLRRAVAVARQGADAPADSRARSGSSGRVVVEDPVADGEGGWLVVVRGEAVAIGDALGRVTAAAAAERLHVIAALTPGDPTVWTLTAAPAPAP